MSVKSKRLALATALAAGALAALSAQAQVGEQISKSMSQNIEVDPALLDGLPPEAEHTYIKYLRTYVPAQLASGLAAPPVEYRDISSVLVKTRTEAKPLISAFQYGPVDMPEPVADENVGGFVGHGRRDTYAAVSLDDGNTWKTTNLSRSADLFAQSLPTYPGDVINIALAVGGRHIAVA